MWRRHVRPCPSAFVLPFFVVKGAYHPWTRQAPYKGPESIGPRRLSFAFVGARSVGPLYRTGVGTRHVDAAASLYAEMYGVFLL